MAHRVAPAGSRARGPEPPIVWADASIRVAACQINTVVGDLAGNVERILGALAEAEAAGADLAVFPELAVTGYPPEDLLGRPAFVADNLAAFAGWWPPPEPVPPWSGYVDIDPEGRLVNAAALCATARCSGRYLKRMLPNYGVFDEQRWFAPGPSRYALFVVAGVPVGVSVCEDMWFAGRPDGRPGGGRGPAGGQPQRLAVLRGRREERLAVLADRVAETGCAIVYVNQVGGQDELVFDGASLVVGADGEVVASAGQFAEEVLVVRPRPRARCATGGDPGPAHRRSAACRSAREPVRRRRRAAAARPIAPVLDPVGRGLRGPGARAPVTTWARTASPTR